MIKHFTILFLCLSSLHIIYGQKIVKEIEREISQKNIEAHMYFYASDELRGRNTGTVENRIAARYIAERFRAFGVKPLPDQKGYFQDVPLKRTILPRKAEMMVGDSSFQLWDDIIFLDPANLSDTTSYVFINYGTKADIEEKDLRGKVAIGIYAIPPDGIRLSKEEMVAILKEKGAIALMELYRPSKFDWPLLVNYLSNDSYELYSDDSETGNDFPVGWIVDPTGERLKFFKESDSLKLVIQVSGSDRDSISVPNVVGYIEGTDPKLREEHILISAHLDHVGVKKVPAGEDSIYNGARDNGIGITNMLTTAEYFARHPPKRSLIFVACNAEEVGLLGSEWYASHPLIPLKKTVFNINTDTGGYNDITKVTVVGLNKTNTTKDLIKAGKSFGLDVIDDPVPEENMYQRSDQYSFAQKGVPAISFDPGYTAIDEEIEKYYHQPGDEPATLDFEYLTKYCKSYIYAVHLLAEKEDLRWKEGDPYEALGKTLYE